MSECPFCDYDGPSEVLMDFEAVDKRGGVFVIEPIDPVAPGHVLVIPRRHIADFAQEPGTTSLVFDMAAFWWQSYGNDQAANLITSKGREATQTIDHLHVHVVPRTSGDGLALPWTTPNYRVPCVKGDSFFEEQGGVNSNHYPGGQRG